jgi:hypothetical protein
MRIQPLTRRPGSFVVAFRCRFPDIDKDGLVFVWTTNRWGSWSANAYPAIAPMDPKYIIEFDEQFDKDGVVFMSTRPWYTSYNPNYNLYECPFGGRPRFIRNLGIGWEAAPIFLATHPKNPGQILIGHTGNFVHQWDNTVDIYVYEGSGSTLAARYSFNPYVAFRLRGISDEFNYRRGVAAHPAVSGRYGFIAWAQRAIGGEFEPVAAVFDADVGILRTIPLTDYIPRDIAGGQFALHLGDSANGILYVPTWSPSALYVLLLDRESLIVNNVVVAINMPLPQPEPVLPHMFIRIGRFRGWGYVGSDCEQGIEIGGLEGGAGAHLCPGGRWEGQCAGQARQNLGAHPRGWANRGVVHPIYATP